MKKPNLTKTQIFLLGIAYAVFTIYIWAEFVEQSVAYFRPFLEPKQRIIVEKELVEVEMVIEQAETDIEAYVMAEVLKAGLNPQKVWSIIQCESGWNPYAINKNTNNTFDTGIFQINDIHKLDRACSFDYKCATEWSIELMKKQGFSPWVCARKLGIK